MRPVSVLIYLTRERAASHRKAGLLIFMLMSIERWPGLAAHPPTPSCDSDFSDRGMRQRL